MDLCSTPASHRSSALRRSTSRDGPEASCGVAAQSAGHERWVGSGGAPWPSSPPPAALRDHRRGALRARGAAAQRARTIDGRSRPERPRTRRDVLGWAAWKHRRAGPNIMAHKGPAMQNDDSPVSFSGFLPPQVVL